MLTTRRQLLNALPWAARTTAASERPNILLLMTDQQTWNALSCAGNQWVKTPAMDSLAEAGVRFERCDTPYPVCSPARGTLFTSRMPHETGVRENGKAIADGMATMGETFAAAGYETVYGGKWHLPRSFGGAKGFRYLTGGSSQGSDMDAPLAGACADWLRSRKGGQPFLMVASFMNPHDICDWIRRHKGRRETELPADCPPAPGNPHIDPAEPDAMRYHRTQGYDLMSQAVGIAAEWREREFREYLHGYYRMVEAVDAQIGRVLEALRESGLRDSTLVALTSDHGEGMGAHGWVQKASFYEESVRVPLILAGPGVGRRAYVDRKSLTSLADLFPTFCDFAGAPMPPQARGASLRGACAGRPLGREFTVSELRYGSAEREGRMLRTGRHKYVVFNTGDRREQFFDLQKDPGETANLVTTNRGSGELDRHRRLLRGWIRSTGDDFQMPS